jgi:arabinogalactan endo-1,4-beta-galactosidase
MMKYLVRIAGAVALAGFLAACGGANDVPAQKIAAAARAPLRAAPPATITPTDLAVWAQATYSQFFNGASTYGTLGSYSYRHYADTGNYLGFAGNDVYVFGPVSGYSILQVGTLDGFTCAVHPSRCAPGAVRAENDDFSAPTADSCRWADWHQSGGSATQGNGLTLRTSAAAGTFSAARRVSQYMIKGDAELEVTVQALSGFEPIAGSAQLYASFGLVADDNNRFFISLSRQGSQTAIHALRVTSTDGNPNYENFPSIPVAAESVRLRIAQSGPTASLQYNAGAGWVVAASVPSFPSDAYAEMTATAVGVSRDFAAKFSNFEVVSGATSWRAYVRGETRHRADFMAGATGGDSINTRYFGQDKWAGVNPFAVMRAAGLQWFASDMRHYSSPLLAANPQSQWRSLGWHDEFWRSRELVAASLKEAKAAGLRLYVQLLLSDQVAYFGLQRAPAAWAGRSVAETADLLRADTAAHVAYLKSQGLDIEVFALGNETDIGVLDFLPGLRVDVPPGVSMLDPGFLRSKVWPTEAVLMKAAAEGVKSVYPNAKLVVHPAGLPFSAPSHTIAKAFFKFMKEQGVPYDIAGISHPYANDPWRLNEYTADCWMQRTQELSDYNADLGKKTMIVEASYPRMPGAYSDPIPDFAYSDQGQAAFVREHLRHGYNNPNMAGFLYFYGDYYVGMTADPPDGLQKPGLFYPDRTATPAMLEFGVAAGALARR